MAFTPNYDVIDVEWKDYEDPESDIESYTLSLWVATSCESIDQMQPVGEAVKIGNTLNEFQFRELDMSQYEPYIVKIDIVNKAGLVSHHESSPVLFDDSIPVAGLVVEGANYTDDIVWWGEPSYIEGI